MLSVAAMPPYSLFDNKDYGAMSSSDPDKYKFIEYHKWKFKAKIFSPLAPLTVKRTPVLMTRVEYGFWVPIIRIRNLRSRPSIWVVTVGEWLPSTYAQETIGLRGYENGSIAGNGGYNSYRIRLFSFGYGVEISVLAGAFLYDLRIGILWRLVTLD